tara:strand:+ start:161 stop:613 length:453 start_codon:yes stop_codon:yes gene_type:complete
MAKKSISKTQGISKILKTSNSVLKQLETADKYSEQLDSLARLSLEHEDAKIDVQIFVKVTPPQQNNENTAGPKDLLKALRESKDPSQFVEALSNIDDSIHDHKNGDTDPKYYEAQLDSVDNTTFLKVVDKLLQHYKSQSNQLLIKLKSLL